MRIFIILVYLFCSLTSFAQDDKASLTWEDSLVKKSYVIVGSFSNFDDAKKTAQDAAKKLGYPLKLNDVSPNSKTGLTHSKKYCEELGSNGSGVYPCYLPRDSWADGQFVSVEFSNVFDGFAFNYFIVVVASDKSESPTIQTALKLAKSKGFKDAYAKSQKVFAGCMY